MKATFCLADRGFASFAHLALLFLRQMHGVFRCHQQTNCQFSSEPQAHQQTQTQKGNATFALRPTSGAMGSAGRVHQTESEAEMDG